MAKHSEFKEAVKTTSEEFNKVNKKEIIRIVSHLDADGICAASILISALNKENRSYNISILPQLKEDNLKEFAKEETGVFVFTDLGSGQLDFISNHLQNKKVFILDHHIPQSCTVSKNITHLNPCCFDIDGSSEISGAGVVYRFVKELTGSRKMSHVAIIGAIGDNQANGGFSSLNQEILDDAVAQGLLEVTKGLKFFGLQTRPIHKLLQYSTDVVIPGVTGSESGAVNFLMELGINPKKGNYWKRLNDLTVDEKKKLVAGIILKRADLPNPDDIFADIYILNNEKENSPLREAKEFSTLLNSCGRLGKASLGIGACLDDPKLKDKAVRTLSEYKRAILMSINWFNENKDKPGRFIKGNNYMIINAHNNVPPTMIGTLTSILSMGNEFKKGFYLLSLAQNPDFSTKVSLRISGNGQDVDLRGVISSILDKLGSGEGGGHAHAAGAVIDTEKEEEFIRAAVEVLEQLVVEEKISG